MRIDEYSARRSVSGLGTGDLTFRLRYALGLTKIEKSSDVKNRGFTFGLGLMFPIGR